MKLNDSSILVKALSATRSAVTITDCIQPDNPIIYCNQAFLDLTKYNRNEVIGRNCRFLQGEDTKRSAVAKIRDSIAEKTDCRVLIKNYTADGKPFWNDLMLSPVFDSRGNLTHFIGLQLNVTQQVEKQAAMLMARQLKERNQILGMEKEQLLKLNEAKDDFISIASHQLRTPATAVKQYLGMLLEGFGGDEISESSRKIIQSAYDSNDRQLTIIEDLLKTARVDSGGVSLHHSSTDINNLLLELKPEFEYQLLNRGQSLQTTFTKSDTTIWCDADLLKMAFENLIDNAIKYSGERTAITLKTTATKTHVTIHVIDEGAGVSEKELAKLFTKFSRIQNESTKNIGGTGLGLYWVKRVVMLHGGTIEYKRRKTKGSDFVVTLPRRSERE